MDNGAEQQFRIWVDTILQVIKDGLARHILNAYKQKYSSVNYMAVIRDHLQNQNGDYPDEIFVGDEILLAKIDPLACLNLMLREWDKLFSTKLGKNGRRHIEKLRDVRNLWAHHKRISLDDVRCAAESAIYLLDAYQCQKEINLVREVINALPSVNGGNSSKSESNQPDSEGSTEQIQTISEEMCVEIVGADGRTECHTVHTRSGRIIIGRGIHSNVCVDDPRVSRVHLLLLPNGTDGLKIVDLHSANGTKLEGQDLKPNQPAHWMTGMSIVIGNTWLILRRGQHQI
jgi:uncharacterized protein